jgi:hypothetical protein
METAKGVQTAAAFYYQNQNFDNAVACDMALIEFL